MRLSSRSEYGLRTMVDLAMVHGSAPLSLSQIAKAENISLAYLEQLMAVLRKEGLVESVRGARGGYRLKAAPDRISVGDVVRALEGPIAPLECVTPEGLAPGCAREPDCPTRPVWVKLRDCIRELLDSVSLADLCERRL